MSKNLQPLTKWMPIEIIEWEEVFKTCVTLKITCLNLINRLSSLFNSIKLSQHSRFNLPLTSDNELEIQRIEDISSTMENIVEKFNKCFQDLKVDSKTHLSVLRKLKIYRDLLWKVKLKLCYILESFISEIAHLFVYYGESLLAVTLRISTCYNHLLNLDIKFNLAKDVSVCNNTCPYLMFPLRKFSVTRLLQILAHNRAELCCHKLIDCLLETYKMYDNSDEDNSSDNSSLEIYMALTKHMSPPIPIEPNIKKGLTEPGNIDDNSGSFVNLEELISSEESNVLNLLSVTLRIAPIMLGNDGIKKSKTNGLSKISTKAQNKVLEYYEQILWAEVGNFLEHVILWWAASPLSARPPHSTQHLREWINQFIPTAEVPSVVLSALTSLADALGVHVTSTMWDQHFRLALVASKTTCNPETGKLFCSVLQDLTMLCNQCESTPYWILGAPLDELPLVEQIPVLHRLDHSVHTTRLWAVNECKKVANAWNVEAFFSITHNDIVACLSQLNNLRLNDHTIEIEKGGLGVHVEVCALMRAKLVSEVKVNIQKLKDTPKECVEGLASVCRTISLANLQMIFPSNIWQIENGELPDSPGPYVQKYLCSDNSADGGKEKMPAEMYVPNQEQWLELRANKKKYFMNPMCCGTL